MAEMTGWPTDGAEGSVSSEARWRKMAKLWAPSGVVDGFSGELAPTLGAGVINVAAGAAWVDGHYCELEGPVSEANSANGLLVVRFTPADNSFEVVYRDGVSAPTQSDAVWELPIAQMIAGALTDRRPFIDLAGGPRGAVAHAQVVANQSPIGTSDVDLTGLAVTVNVPANRRVKITGDVRMRPGAAGRTFVRVKEGSTELNVSVLYSGVSGAPGEMTHKVLAVLTPTAGPHTYKLAAAGEVAGAVAVATATTPNTILVEDIGPA